LRVSHKGTGLSGFHIGAQNWFPSHSEVQAILKAKIQNLRDFWFFPGPANFDRRPLHNFLPSPQPPELKSWKKDVPWSWGPPEQNCSEELKSKMSNPSKLGVPHSTGEMVIITEAPEIGGGSMIFQW